MCGICGKIEFDQIDQGKRKAIVQKMNDALLHRGPDGEGNFHDDKVSLAMRRLSIIDLEGGNQPLWNQDKTVCVFQNGEIYNYQDIKENLIAKGHTFYSNSDTEVYVHLYEEYGDDFSSHLNGMFSYCLYDLKKEKVIISRDRFGEKPLYYHASIKGISFSSEVTSLLQDSDVPRILNEEALVYYLGLAYIPEPITLLKNVEVLPAGNTMIIEKGEFRIFPYFKIDYSPTHKISNLSEAKEHIKPYLNKAIERQSISDVPLGAFLSGGIDSSTVCSILQKHSDKPIKTFTVRFEEAGYDESPIAKEVATQIGSEHHEITVPNSEFSEEIFWKIIDHVGLPFPDSSAIPVYYITKEIRKHVKVALSGDGGDEIFAGYPVFGWWQKINGIVKYPKLVRKALRSVLSSGLIPLDKNRIRQLNRGLTASLKGEKGISLEIHRMFLDEEVESILKGGAKFGFELATQVPESFSQWTGLRKAMYHRLKHNLPTDMLIKVDRMSMANSLEVRAPFLDKDLFEASLLLDDDLLYKDGKGKRIIREIMKDELPDSVFNHPKSGFSIPLHKYQNDEFWALVDQLINDKNPVYKLFDKEALEALKVNKSVDIKNSTIYRKSHQLWAMLLLFGWVKRFNIEVE